MAAAMDTSNRKRKSLVGRKGHNDKNRNDEKTSSANKKRALMHERQSHRRHYEEVRKAKEIWNKLRVKDTEKKEMDEMVSELMTLFNGKMKEVVLKHDASRIVQALIQFGSNEQRKLILNELSESIPEMSKIQYAHFVVLKLIKYCGRDEACRRIIVKSVKGFVPKLAVHAVGARVVELLFTTFPSKSVALLKQEMYGPKYAIFQTGDHSTASLSLKEIIKLHPESSSSAILYLHGVCDRGIEKGLFAFSYFQELLWEFMENANSKQLKDIIPSLVDHSIHLLSTRAGAKVVSYCAAYGTPKDRRKIMKNLKGYTKSSLLHKDAYIAILRLLDVTDDTVAIQKNILAELLSDPNEKDDDENTSPLLEIALDDTGHKFFLSLLVNPENNPQLFDPFELELLKPATCVDKDSGETVSTSKKNPDTRRRELAQYMRQSICDLCASHTDELLRSKNGSKVISLAYQSFPSESENLASQMVEACKSEEDEGEEQSKEEGKILSLFEDPIAHFMIQRLILNEVQNESKSEDEGDSKDSKSYFSNLLAKKYEGRVMEIASSNRGAFILSALVKGKDCASVKNELKMAKNMKILKKRKKEKGFEALLKSLE